jgi:hypothetical protein
VLRDAGAVVIRYDCKFAEQETGYENEDGSSKDDAASATTEQDDIGAAEEAAPEEQAAVEVLTKRSLPPCMRAPSQRIMQDSYVLLSAASDEPATLKAALQQSDAEIWQQAADEEMQSLQLGVYTLEDRPAGLKLLRDKWVLKKKHTKGGLVSFDEALLDPGARSPDPRPPPLPVVPSWSHACSPAQRPSA